MAVHTLPDPSSAGAVQQLFFLLLLQSRPIISIGAPDASPAKSELFPASDDDHLRTMVVARLRGGSLPTRAPRLGEPVNRELTEAGRERLSRAHETNFSARGLGDGCRFAIGA